MKKWFNYIVLLLVISANLIKAQDVGVGQWQMHVPYTNAISIAAAGDLIYCATEKGMFSYNKQDNSIKRLSKINGLSDQGISRLSYNKKTNTLLVAYQNTNIDLIKGDKIINMNAIKNKSIVGDKTISNIYMKDEYAYLACGFGIVILNLAKQEFADTYYLGNSGSSISINDITTTATTIYAATDAGVYSAPLVGANLADFSSWHKQSITTNANVTNKKFNAITTYNDKVICNFSSSAVDKDTLYELVNNIWKKSAITYNYDVNRLSVANDQLVVTYTAAVYLLDANYQLKGAFGNYFPGVFAFTQEVVIDNDGYWVADKVYGLTHSKDLKAYEFLSPNGPSTYKSFNMYYKDSTLWVATGGYNESGFNYYRTDGILKYKNHTWSTLKGNSIPQLYAAADITGLAFGPNNSKKIFISTWGYGCFEIEGNTFLSKIDENNSTLRTQPGNGSWLGVNNAVYDKSGNLWAPNSYATNILSVRKTDGNWKSFNVQNIPFSSQVRQLIVTTAGDKWMVLPKGSGIAVYNENGTIDDVSDDKQKMLTTAIDKGGLNTNEVRCLAEDLNGDVWVGTAKGITVFYNAGNVLKTETVNAQQVKINITGNVEYLLEAEEIRCIVIDNANRKWIGTASSGIYLISEDGSKQLQHFTTKNSPLLSDAIICAAINPSTGDVFIGTEEGIVSYKGEATEGKTDCSEIYAYPNPVREDYEGVIAIKGMPNNSTVKITDVSGNLVTLLQSYGGQAVWDGKNTKGAKVNSGIYIAFTADPTGKKHCITKILIAN